MSTPSRFASMLKTLALAAVAVWGLSQPARAATVVSNLGEVETGQAPIFGDPSAGVGTPFTPGPGSWQINSITIRLSDEASPINPDPFQFDIRADDGGHPSTTVLGTLDMSANNVTTLGNYTYPLTSPLVLPGGTRYWLVGLPTFLDAQDYWSVTTSAVDNGQFGWVIDHFNLTTADLGTVWAANGNEPGMFAIDATAVPEPSTLVLALGALAAMGLAACRRR